MLGSNLLHALKTTTAIMSDTHVNTRFIARFKDMIRIFQIMSGNT